MNRREIEQYIGIKKKIRIERNFSERYANGFITSASDSILIMQQFHDFYSEGYCALRMKDIVSYRSNEYERFFEKMLEAEGILENLKDPDIPHLSNMRELLTYFKFKEANIILECEYENSEDDIFMCGKVSEIENDTLWFKSFDALGCWLDEETGVDINDVTMIQFDTPYLNVFSKFVPTITKG